MTPDVIHALYGIATVGGHETVQEIVFPIEGQIKAAPGKGAGHRLNVSVRLVYRFALAALDAIGHHIEGGDDLIRHEAAKVADHFLTRIVQLPGAVAPFRV